MNTTRTAFVGTELRSHYAIDSTGRAAKLAIEAGARRHVYDKLVAVWAVLEVAETSHRHGHVDQDRQTYIEATPDGWWYTTRMPGARRVLAFFTDGDMLKREIAQSPWGFLGYASRFRHLQEIAPWSGYRICAGPTCAPAMSTQLELAYGPAWIAAGDAAHSFDPLSSQRILSALVSGNNAAAALVARHASPLRDLSR
jgi:flavin-dependent dehydrogenase